MHCVVGDVRLNIVPVVSVLEKEFVICRFYITINSQEPYELWELLGADDPHVSIFERRMNEFMRLLDFLKHAREHLVKQTSTN